MERARKQVAALIGASARKEIVFTSGATEANNLAITGRPRRRRRTARHLVTVATEHKAVLDPCRALEAQGWQVTVLPVAATGLVDLAAVEQAVTPGTALVSVMLANNEIGVVQPLAEIGAPRARAGRHRAHRRGAGGWASCRSMSRRSTWTSPRSARTRCTARRASARLYVKRGVDKRLRAQVRGGGQERGLRRGTLNVPGIVGFGAACDVAGKDLTAEMARLGGAARSPVAAAAGRLDGVTVNGAPTPRLPGNLNVTFDGIDGEALLLAITDMAVSSGAACTSAEPSHVLTALGLDTRRALASLRFGLGRDTTADDIAQAAEHIVAVVSQLRAQSPRRVPAGAGAGGRA